MVHEHLNRSLKLKKPKVNLSVPLEIDRKLRINAVRKMNSGYNMGMKKIKKTQLQYFLKEISFLLKSPFFLFLTFFGNGFIGLCSLLFYSLEHEKNHKVVSHLDALWWSFSTATTTGYGDITPVTITGKFLGIFLMLTGLALFAMYTALFAEIMLTSKKKLEQE